MWLLVVIAAAAAVVVPTVLIAIFHGPDRVDARGRRLSRAWRGPRRR